ncbi:MAG: FtsX-like permease family protein [Desulfuromonadales bacterium]|nr:FtsX-like permease family protein [Desulfuromonadales bacterium]
MNLRTIAFNNLRRRKGRMAFLLAGLLIGVATVVTLFSLTTSLTLDAEHKLDRYGANIVITPKRDDLSLSYGGITLAGVNVTQNELRMADLQRIGEIKNFNNIAGIAPKVLGAVEINGVRVLLMGVSPEVEFALKRWWNVDGRPLVEDNELVVGSSAAQRLGLTVGEQVTIDGSDFVITGILQPTGSQDDELVIGTLAVAQRLFAKEGLVSLVEVAALCAGCPIEEMVEQIAAVLPQAEVNAIQQVVKTRMHALAQFQTFALGISAVVLFIGALVVLVTMMGSVNERTREIGIFRALGFRRGHVVALIEIEAVTVSCFAGLFGYLLGMGATRLILPFLADAHLEIIWDLRLAGGALLLAVVIGALASLYPALHASRMEPTTALRAL